MKIERAFWMDTKTREIWAVELRDGVVTSCTGPIAESDVSDDLLDAAGVEVVGALVVVGRGGDDDEFGPGVGLVLVGRHPQPQVVGGQPLLDARIGERAASLPQHLDAPLVDVVRDDVVVLGEEHGEGQADVRGTHYADAHPGTIRAHGGATCHDRGARGWLGGTATDPGCRARAPRGPP